LNGGFVDAGYLTGVTSGVTMSGGQAAAAGSGTVAGAAPLSATVKVLGPTSLMKQVKDTSSAGSVLASRTGTAVVSLQPVLIRPGTAMTVASAAASSQTSTMQASVIGSGRTSTTSSAGGASNLQPMLPGVQQTVHDIVQQAQAQASRQNTIGFVTATSTTSFVQQTPGAVVGSPLSSVSSVSPVTAIHTAADAAAAAAAAAAASQNKSSPYVMRLRNQRS